MIDLYSYNSFNGHQISIALEELELDYNVHKIDLMKGEHKSPSFRAINPSVRIPVIVDHNISSGGVLTLTQTSAILIYLAEKCGKLLPKDAVSKAKMLEWLSFHVTDITTSLFNAFYLSNIVEEPQDDAAALLKQRALGFYQFFDQQLGQMPYLCGDDYTIADISAYPVATSVIENPLMSEYKNIHRWLKQVSQRPAVIRGMKIPE